MNWQAFLKHSGLPDDTACLQNPHQEYALLRVTGTDAETFLHAQLSNSVTGIQEGEVRFAAWCTAKGRVWTLIRYWKDGDAIILRMPAEQMDDTVKRLRMFVLRSDVQLQPMGWKSMQFLGPDAETHAIRLKEQIGDPGYLIALPLAWHAREVWRPEPLNSELPELPENLTALPRILTGLPEIFISQREEWIPQMLNLDKLEGIDFKKGCYPGQEIVAKLHYKGGLKQRMFRGLIENSASSIESGDEISSADGKKAGNVLEAVKLGHDCHLTAIIRLESQEALLKIQDHVLALPDLRRLATENHPQAG